MSAQRSARASEPRRPARDLIDAVLDNMRRNLEPLKYSTLAPSRYLVYVHPNEFARFEGILPILQEQTRRALAEELDRLNRRSPIERYASRWLGAPLPQIQKAAEWQIEFLADPDEVVKDGDILVDSELLLPAAGDVAVGERTRHVSTLRSGHHTTARERTVGRRADAGQPRVHAHVVYDDTTGRHTFDVVKDSVTVGRGGVTYPVDIKIAAAVDVSREHARIRRDPAGDGFFLIDLSSLGTTLNGRHVPPGFEMVEGSKRENGVETPLPDQARIGLADTVFLEFNRVR